MRSKTVSAASAIAAAALFWLATPTASAGNPLPGVDVLLEQIPGGVRGEANTDANGVFEFKGLAKGNYRVVVKLRTFDTRGGAPVARATARGGPAAMAANYNSSRSDVSTSIARPGEPDVVRALIELRQSDEPGAAVLPVDIEITSESEGTISGCIFSPEVRLHAGDPLFDPQESKALLSGDVVRRREAALVRTFIVGGNAFKGKLVAKDRRSPVGGICVFGRHAQRQDLQIRNLSATTREDGTFALDIPSDWRGELVITTDAEKGLYNVRPTTKELGETSLPHFVTVFAPAEPDAIEEESGNPQHAGLGTESEQNPQCS